MNWKALLFITLIVFGAYRYFNQSSQTPVADYSPGITAPNAPIQGVFTRSNKGSENSKDDDAIMLNGYRIQPLEDFSLLARVLSTEHYRFDREAELAPVDIALGWGPMSDEQVLRNIRISQGNRWYYWQTDDFPIPRREIETNSANMHMIPANDEIAAKLKTIKKGQLIRISGYLVEVEAEDGWRWRSSLTRNDTGKGACEVVLVESISVI